MADQIDYDKMISESDMFQLTSNWLPILEGEIEDPSIIDDQIQPPANSHLTKLSRSDGESYSNSPVSRTDSLDYRGSVGSGGDYLDSDLVKAAIERLNIDDSQVTINVLSFYCPFY